MSNNDLVEFVKVLKSDELVEEVGELKRYYEPVKHIRRVENKGKILIFKIVNSPLRCIANVINSRNIVMKIFNAGSDEDLYIKLISLISNVKTSIKGYIEKGFLRIKDFHSMYTRFNGGIEALPSIKFFEKDGGEYITSSIVVAELPDMALHYNASIHRLMRIDNRGYAIRLVPRHLYKIYVENRKKDLETPIAIVVGVHPAILFLASTSPPYGVFELTGYRHITGKPLDIVLTPKYGIPVPANATIVMEGRITLDEVNEGPFVDILQLYDKVRKQPLVKIDDIYVNRLGGYFHVILPGGIEHRLLMGLPREAMIWEHVRRVVPGVVKVRLTPGGGQWLNAVISINKLSEGEGKLAIMAAFTAHPSLKNVIVVDSDIDPDNPTEVEWALATRFQASKDLVIIKGVKGSTLDPSAEDGITDKLGIDATAPLKDREKYLRPKLPRE
ncbi:MAG: hypothetical protein B6U85_00265 [Desulfurococcales archaeon ex4484_42]|nr:MAG: hypothetical protein B6U85_00265 [Desulfurococcales archaeon ex4484_42]